jgi:hypothetical protein
LIPLRRKLTAIAEQTEHERLTALVDAHATENERAELFLSARAGAHVKFGFPLTELVRMAESDGDEEGPPLEYDPAALAAVTARIAVRQELRLPKRECVVRKPPPEAYCNCLAQTLDAAIDSGQPLTRDEVLKAARQAHGERWAWLKRKPEPRPELPAPDPSPLPAPKRKPRPAPPRELVSQTNTKPARVIKRRPKWYDPPPSGGGIMDRQF